jgi:hypothetical protein
MFGPAAFTCAERHAWAIDQGSWCVQVKTPRNYYCAEEKSCAIMETAAEASVYAVEQATGR